MERFKNLGAKNCEVMKNLKFEIDKKTCDIVLNQGNSKVLIAGSTHKGEEEIVFNVYKKLKGKNNNLKLKSLQEVSNLKSQDNKQNKKGQAGIRMRMF